jgi:hypothetical protein
MEHASLPAPIAAEYPFESHFLDVDGGRLHYVDEGPRDAEPILFLHGNPTWSFLWRNLVREFRATHRCIAIDHIGCGLSAKPANWRYSLTAHAENARAVVGTGAPPPKSAAMRTPRMRSGFVRKPIRPPRRKYGHSTSRSIHLPASTPWLSSTKRATGT